MFDRKGQRKYLNSTERTAFQRAAQRERDSRRRAFCLLLLHTGCRITECLNLTAERIDKAGGAAVFETLKRRKRGHFRSVPIPNDLLALLAKLAASVEPSDRIWKFSRATSHRIVKACMARAGVRGGMACPKGLRHGFGIACLEQRIPLTAVKKWLGHARLETTAIYLDASGKEERNLAKRLWRSGRKR